MRVGSLFSGIGGLDLGLERAGMEVIWQSEIGEYPSKVLKKHWPDVPNLGDITKIDWSTVERPDLICGGYPCQPFSVAGKRKGEADERHLWPFFADAIRHLRPEVVLLENVPGHLSLGFGSVLGDLSALGYDAEWSTVSACAVGHTHTRTRLLVVAYTKGSRCSRRRSSGSWPAGEHSGPGSYLDGCELPKPITIRVAHGAPDRVDRNRALGNAVVPQVAELLGDMILAASS